MKKRASVSRAHYFMLFIGTFILDRVTKLLALTYVHERIELNRFISCDLIFNRGISWGMFHSESPLVFGIVSFVILLVAGAIGFYAFINWMNNNYIFGETLVLSGALSNLLDRVMYHGVVDFIACSWGTWAFPVFNVADACIVVGVLLMLFENYRSS